MVSANMQTLTPGPVISKHVFFYLQNNNNEVETAEQTRPMAPQTNHATQMDQAPTHSLPKSTRLAIPPAAEPSWNAAKHHQQAEQKAKLRADHIDHLLENGIILAPYLVSERLPSYFLLQDSLPTPMLDLILRHGREKALIATDLHRQQQMTQKGYADFYISPPLTSTNERAKRIVS